MDTNQARIMQRDGDTPLPTGWQVRVTYNFHLPVIHTASDAASIATYGRVPATVEEDPELDTIEACRSGRPRSYGGTPTLRRCSISCCGPVRQDRSRGTVCRSFYRATVSTAKYGSSKRSRSRS